jgi:hypothetical protein
MSKRIGDVAQEVETEELNVVPKLSRQQAAFVTFSEEDRK